MFVQSSLPRAAILITLLLGLLALYFWWETRSEQAYRMLGITAITWFVANSQYFDDFRDARVSTWFGALNDAATTGMLCVVILFALRLENWRWPRVESGLLGYVVLATLVPLPVWNHGVYGMILQHYVDALVIVCSLGYLSWQAFRRGGFELRIVVSALWFLPILGVRDITVVSSQRDPNSIHLFPYATFIVFGAFLYVMQRRYLGARTALAELNASLDRRLRQREAELAELHGKQLAQEQERVLQDERQRIMRDMHDGVGTVLMSSLAMAEQGRLPAERTAVVLRDSLDQIKLVIDSLEPVENDIVALLANLRYRFGQRVEEAGVHIDWAMEELPRLPWLDAGASLHVLRIVQEAVTNTLKHAGASQLRIAARVEEGEAEPEIAIVIADDGRGFDPAGAGRGRGLRNLRYRAEQLGGRLRIRSTPGEGTVIELRLPLAGRTAST